MNFKQTFIFIFFLLSSCLSNSNIFEDRFSPSSEFTAPSTVVQDVNVIESEDFPNDLKDLAEEGYHVLGLSVFKGILRSNKKAIEFAKKINASDILYHREYMGKKYINIQAAMTKGPGYKTMGTRSPAGAVEKKKFAKEKIHQYRVAYLVK